MNAKFDSIIDADRLVRTNHVLSVSGSDEATRARAEVNLPIAKEKLFTLLDTLTSDEVVEFRAYRASIR